MGCRFLPIPLSTQIRIFPSHVPIPPELVVAADAMVYVAKKAGEELPTRGEPYRPCLTAPFAPCTILKARVTVVSPRMRGFH